MFAARPVTAGLALQSTIANNQMAARCRTTKTTGVLILVSHVLNLFAADSTARGRALAREDSFQNRRLTLRSISTKDARDLLRLTPAVSCAAVRVFGVAISVFVCQSVRTHIYALTVNRY
jgi:Tfp pilus assembly ATPase PilU